MNEVVIVWLLALTVAVLVCFACAHFWTKKSGSQQRRADALDKVGSAICELAIKAASARTLEAGLCKPDYARSGWLHHNAIEGDQGATEVAYMKFYEQERERYAKLVVDTLVRIATQPPYLPVVHVHAAPKKRKAKG